MTALLPCPHCGAPAYDFGGDLCGCSERCFGNWVMSYEKWNLRAPIPVDDAMVERATAAWNRTSRGGFLISMRAALEAAVGGGK